ncbi:HAD family hydrolase [Streptomyces prasinopilosus]|uniref:HAD family hydrolase n=1 Tax=Streptomyces prasinopilosus TaxID=67344 RepID=UPI000BFF6C82
MVRRPLGNHHDGPDTLLVTSDATRTGPVARGTEDDRKGRVGPAGLEELVRDARLVLWDFDGSVCRLFAGRAARLAAADLVEWLEDRGLHGLLTESEREAPHPHAVLRAVARGHPGGDLVAELEERVTRQEMPAASSAWPTPYADPLIRTWTAAGARPAIASDTSPRVIRAYLATRGLVDCFAPRIHGRTRDLGQLKPDPGSLHRALSATGVAASRALMIGNMPADHEAALRDSGAGTVLDSLEPLLRLLRR